MEWNWTASVAELLNFSIQIDVYKRQVFGVYSDEACTKLITQMPATDKNGKSSVTIIKTQDTVYLKEIKMCIRDRDGRG